MTRQERTKPEIIDGSRRRRIAEGSGTSPGQVSALLKQFKDMQRMMKKMGGAATGGGGGAAKKGGKKGRRKGGGRVTPKGTGSAPKVPAELPMDLPGLN